MSQEQSEEKSLPPSHKKLREGRKKGQISKSQDVVSAMSMIVLTVYLIAAWPSIKEQFATMFAAAARSAARLGEGGWRVAMVEIWDAMAAILLPLYALSVLAVLVGAIISNKGIVVSFHPVKPDLKKINPVEGFKKIFSLRNFVEFLKALVKSVALLGALGFAAWSGFSVAMSIPNCGADCVGEALGAVAAPLVIAALALFLIAALVDMNLQKWLFTRDMRMTHTEFKRELKEMYGDPLIRGARNQMRREAAQGGGGGLGNAAKALKSRDPTVLICAGSEIAVGLRYVPGETSAPVVVAKAAGQRAGALIEQAIATRISVAEEPELAEELLRRTRMEAYIPEAMFRSVARVLKQTGALS